jgi:hypothetical protein
VYSAATIQPSVTPVVVSNRRRAASLSGLAEAASRLRSIEDVVAVDVFRAIVKPPTANFSAYLKERRGSVGVADFDVAMLIQTSSVAAISGLQKRDQYAAAIEILRREAQRAYVMPAHNVRRLGDVETTSDACSYSTTSWPMIAK